MDNKKYFIGRTGGDSGHLEDAADAEAAGAGPVRGAADLRALVAGEAGAVVAAAARALRVLELDPGDQVQKLGHRLQ